MTVYLVVAVRTSQGPGPGPKTLPAIEAAARELVEKCEDLVGIPATYVQATPDLVMGDLLRTMRSSQIFIFSSLLREWRGDYVGMVLYLDDQHGILGRRLPRPHP